MGWNERRKRSLVVPKAGMQPPHLQTSGAARCRPPVQLALGTDHGLEDVASKDELSSDGSLPASDASYGSGGLGDVTEALHPTREDAGE
ncbi:hypothetical protein NM688_g843 [Phlebia brevispora]|uniref:Uncharacterized protein n=1 Tax=Phlebia brevispora TaxID=194682 RepID=A0ACC1TDD2_9APHY|nr:hypothetical protein NM688_g843 [Phlebia brevispora]